MFNFVFVPKVIRLFDKFIFCYDNFLIVPGDMEPVKFICQDCDKEFVHRGNLYRHYVMYPDHKL